MSVPESARENESPGSDHHHPEPPCKHPRLSMGGGDDSDPLVPDDLYRRATFKGHTTRGTIASGLDKRRKQLEDRLDFEYMEIKTLLNHGNRLYDEQMAILQSPQPDDRSMRRKVLEIKHELRPRAAFHHWLTSRLRDARTQTAFLRADIACWDARAAASLVICEPTELHIKDARSKIEMARDSLYEAQSILDTNPRSDANLADIAWKHGPDGPVLSPHSWLTDLDEEYYRDQERKRKVETEESKRGSGTGV